MLPTVSQSDLTVFEHPGDDAIVAPPRGPKTVGSTNDYAADGHTVAGGAEWARET
jgi:hypothetical protein